MLLEAGKAHVVDRSKSSNAGAEVGVGVVVGAQTGVYVYAEASVGSSKANSDSNTWQNTTLTGQNISLKAEGDTTLRGATATADRIDVKTGGTLTIESLQDIAESMSRNSQVGGRVQVAFGNAWNADGYASAGKAEGSYQGVGQQSGLFAGNGGYHVDAGHVNLIGGAIASTNAANSELTAQTLTFSDLQNQMDYSASSGSISGGAGGQMKGWDPKAGTTAPRGGPGMSMTENGSDSSSTLATLTEGNITIGGKQTTAAELGINTDASAAHRALEAMPDATKLLADQQAMAAAAGTVLSTSRQISGDLASRAQAGAANAYDGFVESLEGQDLADFQALDAKGKQNYVLSHSADYRNFYRSQLQWGIGGDYSRALGAVTTALIGGASGQGGSQIVGNALAPYAAQLIGEKFDTSHGSDPNAVAQALSHALLGAVLAELNGGSASVGAVAGVGGEIAAGVLMQAFPYADKETISALSQAVGALAGGAAGGDLAQIALNMGISKNAVENNRLLNVIELARIKELSNGDVVREAELTAAACALVKCSAGFAEGSVERAEWAAIEALGSTPEALDDRQWLKVQVQPGYLYTAGNGVATQEQLFDYAFTDYLFDWGSRNQAGVRAFGGLQAVGGAAQAAGGIAVSPSCASIIGCVGAGFLIASGYDNAVAGTNTLFTGKPTATWGGQAFQAAGISPDVAELLYALSQVGTAGGASGGLVRGAGELLGEQIGRKANQGNFSRYLSNSTAPEIQQSLAGRVSDLRGTLPLELQAKGNIAVANVEIAGLPSELRAFSRYAEGEAGFVAAPEGETVFKTPSVGDWGRDDGKNAFLRDVDGEFKILENVARSLGHNPAAVGRIDLFTELKACASCSSVILQFRARYPGIQLNVYSGK